VVKGRISEGRIREMLGALLVKPSGLFSLSVARVSPQMSSVMRVVFAIRHRRPNNNSSLGGRPVPPPAGVGVEVMVRIRDRIRISGVGTFMAGRVEGGRSERSATEAIRHESASAWLTSR